MALTVLSWVPPLTISLLFNSSVFRLLQQVRNNSSAHTTPPFAVTASETVLLPPCGGPPILADLSPRTSGGQEKKGVSVSPSAHGLGSWATLWERSWQPHPWPVVSPQEENRWMRSCLGFASPAVPTTWMMSSASGHLSPPTADRCLLSPSCHHHQPHYPTMYNLPPSSPSFLSAASIPLPSSPQTLFLLDSR